MLGYPKVLVCDAGASGPQPSLTAEASGHSQRGFSVYICSCVLVCVTLCFYLSGTQAGLRSIKSDACCAWFYVCIFVYAHECVSPWRCVRPSLNVE